MKTWIKRTLIAVVGASTLFGGLAAWATYRHHGWGGMSDEQRAEMRARMLERVAGRLDLDAAQNAKLRVLADQLQAQRKAVVGERAAMHAQVLSLVAGPAFDRTRAGALVETKLGAAHVAAPQVINAFADFYDSLRPEQQAKVREFLQRGPHGHRG